MNKQDILKVLQEANTISNLTDKQIEQYLSEVHKKQNIERASKGGKTTGKKHLENKTGIFGLTEDRKKEIVANGGKIAGKRNADTGRVTELGKISAKSPNHPNNVNVKCEHCGIVTKLPMSRRWHGDNCKHKK
jgi:hypothetical protein